MRIEEAGTIFFEATRKGALHEFCCFVCFGCVMQVGIYFLALTPSHQDEDEFSKTTMEEMHVGGLPMLVRKDLRRLVMALGRREYTKF
jgi:hypothetical protein